VSTVLAIVTFFAGLARVGPPAAAILSTLEPVVTVVLAAAVFGEVLSPVQLAGAALVLGAAVLVVVSAPRPAAGAVLEAVVQPPQVALRPALPQRMQRLVLRIGQEGVERPRDGHSTRTMT
jgi:hypothetical protein